MANDKLEEINFMPIFEVGESIDIELRVYLPRKDTDVGEHFGKPFQVAVGVATAINNYYRRFRETNNLWVAPIIKVDLEKLTDEEKSKLESAIRHFNKYGKTKVVNNGDI